MVRVSSASPAATLVVCATRALDDEKVFAAARHLHRPAIEGLDRRCDVDAGAETRLDKRPLLCKLPAQRKVYQVVIDTGSNVTSFVDARILRVTLSPIFVRPAGGFCRNLAAGQEEGDALRNAKPGLRKEHRAQATPFYWAGFMTVEDGTARVETRRR